MSKTGLKDITSNITRFADKRVFPREFTSIRMRRLAGKNVSMPS